MYLTASFVAGSGKSVLWFDILSSLHVQKLTSSSRSAIIQHIVAQHEARSAYLAYFYFDFKDTEKQHQCNLRSLLIQFSVYSNACCDTMYGVYSAHGKGALQPSNDTLKRCFKEMLLTATLHPNYIIISALDECLDTTGVPSAREQVLNLVYELVDLHLPNLRICVTSRLESTSAPFLSLRPHAAYPFTTNLDRRRISPNTFALLFVPIRKCKDGLRKIGNWLLRRFLRKPMACKRFITPPRSLLKVSITQVSMGLLSAGDAQALSRSQSSASTK